MELIILLSTLVFSQALVVKPTCDGVWINGIYHAKEILVKRNIQFFFLHYDPSTNDLYFSDTKGKIFRDGELTKLNLETQKPTLIPGVKVGNAYAINNEDNTIYVGRNNGIYKHDMSNKRTTFIKTRNKSIRSMYYKNALYFTTYESSKLYVVKNGSYSVVDDLRSDDIWQFIVDNNVIYFSNGTGLYLHKVGSAKTVLIEKETNSTVTSLAIDPKGLIHACLNDGGVYLVNKEGHQLKNLYNLSKPLHPFGVAFDKSGHIILAEWYVGIYRLIPKDDKVC